MTGPGRLLQRWAPGLGAIRTYERPWLRSDIVAGLVLAAILVPQGMAYAELAGLPAVTGLYTTIACLVAYAVFGPSKVLVLGPDSSVSPLILAAITPLIVTDDPATAIALAGMLAILVGLIEIGLGVAKLGFVADLLSSEVRVGYLNGLAITIIVGQLPKLFGFSTDADSFIGEVRAFVHGLDQTNRTALITGCAVLAVLLVLPRFTRRVPGRAGRRRGRDGGLGRPRSRRPRREDGRHACRRVCRYRRCPWTKWSDIGPPASGAVGITLVSLTDTIATATSFAARRGDEVDPDQEMVGIGTSNIAAGFFQGFAVSVSGSRTAVADQSGAKTQMTGLVGAGLVAVLLLFLNGLLADLPQTALAAVVITAALSLMDLGALRRFAEVRTSSFVVSLVAMGGVILLGVLQGIVVAIVLIVLAVLPPRMVAPRGRPRGCAGPRRMAQHRPVPGGDRAAGHRGLPMGGTALLRQQWPVPGPGPQAGPRSTPVLDRAAVRGDHRHRRHGRRDARARWTRSSTPTASISPSSNCETDSRSWSAATASTPRSTRSTSTRASDQALDAIGSGVRGRSRARR